MENIILTQLSVPEIRQLFRQELESYFANSPANVNPPDTDQLLTIKQAGELLNLSVATIYGLVHKADIPVSKKGKRLYFSKQELLDWVKDGRKKTHSEIAAEADNYLNKKRR
jgi:excisionase family DNA binding protein